MVPLAALIVIGLDRAMVPPAVCCKVPPLNAKVLVPKAALLLAAKVPEVKVVVPAYLLAFDNTKVPAPFIVNAALLEAEPPLPASSPKTSEKVMV